LEVKFEDGKVFHFPAELLRVESPSAEVTGHGSVTGKKVQKNKKKVKNSKSSSSLFLYQPPQRLSLAGSLLESLVWSL
jgi:hypothetical protein